MNALKSSQRFAGLSLILAFSFFAVHFYTIFGMRNWSLTIFLVLLYGLMIFVAAIPINQLFKSHHETHAQYVQAGFMTHGILVAIVCSLIMSRLKLMQEFPEGDVLNTTSQGLELTMDQVRSVSFIFLGIGLFFLGKLIRNTIKWLGWAGIISGVLVMLGFLTYFMDVMAEDLVRIVFLSMMAVTMIFLLVLGIVMLVSRTLFHPS